MCADLMKTVEIIFSGKDDLSKSISNISKSLKGFDSSIMSVARPLADASDAVLKLDAALAAMAVAGLAIAIKTGGDFKDSLAEITTLFEASDESVDKFRTDIIAYARDSTASIDDINSAIYSAISAGVSWEDSLTLLNQAEKLSIAGKADLEATVRVLVSSLNSYGESTDKAADYSNALFQAVKSGQTTLPELANSLSQVSSIAANSGVSFDELMAAIAAITASGAPTSQAITAIKAAISNIIKPSSQASDVAKELGISFNATSLASKGLDGVLKDVYQATGGATEQLVKLFGSTEALPAVLTLGADTSGKFAAALADMANKTGAVETAYSKMADNFGLINQNLANNVKATFIQAGLELLDEYTDVVASISDVFKSLGLSIDSGAFDEIFLAFDKFGADLKDFFDALAASLPEAFNLVDFSGLLHALEDLGMSVTGMFDGFDPSDPQDVADAIQFVVDSIQSLVTVTKGIVGAFDPFIEAAYNAVKAFNAMDDADKEVTGTLLGLGKAITVLGTSLAALMLLIGDNAEAIEKSFNIIIGSLKAGWGGFRTTLQLLAIGVLESIDLVLAAAETVSFGSWKESIQDARLSIQGELSNVADRLVDSVELVNEGWDQVADHISGNPAKGDVQIEPGAFRELKDYWDDPSHFPTVYVVPEIEPGAFRELQNYWDDPTYFPPVEMDLEAKATYETLFKWTDKNGSPHVSDTPPDSDHLLGDIEEVKAPIKTEVDDRSINEAKRKIAQSFKEATMAPVGIDVDVQGTGVGPAFSDKIQNHFKDNPVKMDDIFDPGSLNDLFSAMEGATDPSTIAQIRKAIDQAIDLQKKLGDAQKRYIEGQNALMRQQWELAYQTTMSAEQERTISISADGLEPEMEAFMWKLLKKIQVRANESGAEFLLAASS